MADWLGTINFKGQRIKAVSALANALRILDCFTEHERQLRLSDISRSLGLSKGYTHRLLMLMSEKGILRREPDSTSYRLGFRLFQLGRLVAYEIDLAAVIRPMEDLARLTGETILLGVRDDCEVVIFHQVGSPHALRVSPESYRRLSAWTAMGRVLIAWEQEPVMERAIRHGLPKFEGAPTPERFREMLAETRQRGYAIREPGRTGKDRAVAVPVRGGRGQVLAGLGLAASLVRFPSRNNSTVAAELLRVAAEITTRLSLRENESEMINYLADKDVTTRRLPEGILAMEEDHADDLVTLLQTVDGR